MSKWTGVDILIDEDRGFGAWTRSDLDELANRNFRGSMNGARSRAEERICPECSRVCRGDGGLTMHRRVHAG